MSKKNTEETAVEEFDKSQHPIPGVWYVMSRDFSGWELYKRTKEIVAAAWPGENGRVNYAVWGINSAGGPTTCEFDAFRENIVRIATEADAKLPPKETLA